MIVELIRKELIYKNEKSEKNRLALLHYLLKGLMFVLLMGLEWFIFSSIDEKVSKYSSNSSYHFLLLFLFAILVISIISSSIRARISLFSRRDAKITLTLPIPTETLVIAKMIYVYLKEVIITFILASPLLFSYGLSRNFAPYYYIFTILYPFIISLFSVSISLIVVIIYQYIYKILKLSSFIQFIFACFLVIGLCYLYQFVLQMFLNALSDSSIGGMFSPSFINGLEKITKLFFPVTPMFNAIILRENVFSNVLIVVGLILVVMVIGVFVASSVYNKYSKASINFKINKNHESKLIIKKPFINCLKKEFDLLFKSSGNIFSYTALLIMAPFLSYIVISSMQLILYNNMEFILVYFPELVNGLNFTLILLFVGIINSSASLSISRERKALQIMKYIPVDPIKQIIAKILCPFALSSASLILTLIVLLTTNCISVVTFIIALIIGLILIYSNNVLGIVWDMCDKSGRKATLRFLNAFLAICFPLIILFIHLLTSMMMFDAFYIYLIEIIVSIILLLASIIKIKSRMIDAFRRMEVN